jgi:predicted DNA binding CopG/RHH family protein
VERADRGISEDDVEDTDELNAELDQAIEEGGFTPLGERALRTVRTVPISIRLPETLLAQLKLSAVQRRMSYQRLLKMLVEEGLARPASPREVHRPVKASTRTAARRSAGR